MIPASTTLNADRRLPSPAQSPLRVWQAAPLTINLEQGEALTGALSVVAEIRDSAVTEGVALASLEVAAGDGSGPWAFAFSSAQMNQPIEEQPERDFWLVIVALFPDDRLEPLAVRQLTLVKSGYSGLTPAPPAPALYLTQGQADALYPAIADFTALDDRVTYLEQNSGPGASTNLTITRTATTVTVVSSTGTDGVIPVADASNAGVLSAADKTKLDGVASGATANATDAQLRDRSTHTGTQAISTVTSLQATLDAKVPQTRTVNGYALTANVVLVKGDLGLGNVDNTSDLSKPISTAMQAALDNKQRRVLYDIREYGAQATPGFNNKPFIQNAIDAAEAAGGGTVIIPEGTWEVHPLGTGIGLLVDGDKVTIRGTSRKKSILRIISATSSLPWEGIAPRGYNTTSTIYGASGIWVENFSIECEAYAYSNPANWNAHGLLGFVNCPWGIARDMWFGNVCFHQVEVGAARSVLLDNCDFGGNCESERLQVDIGFAGQNSATPGVHATECIQVINCRFAGRDITGQTLGIPRLIALNHTTIQSTRHTVFRGCEFGSVWNTGSFSAGYALATDGACREFGNIVVEDCVFLGQATGLSVGFQCIPGTTPVNGIRIRNNYFGSGYDCNGVRHHGGFLWCVRIGDGISGGTIIGGAGTAPSAYVNQRQGIVVEDNTIEPSWLTGPVTGGPANMDYINISQCGSVSIQNNVFVLPVFTEAGTFVNGSATITTPVPHGLELGDPIRLTTTGALPSGFATGTTYYATPITPTTFSLAASVAGTPIVAGSAGSGVHTWAQHGASLNRIYCIAAAENARLVMRNNTAIYRHGAGLNLTTILYSMVLTFKGMETAGAPGYAIIEGNRNIIQGGGTGWVGIAEYGSVVTASGTVKGAWRSNTAIGTWNAGDAPLCHPWWQQWQIADGGTGLSALGTPGQVLKVNAGGTALEYGTGAAGLGGSTGSTDNALLRADGTGGATAQGSTVTLQDDGRLTQTIAGVIANGNYGWQSDYTKANSTGSMAEWNLRQGTGASGNLYGMDINLFAGTSSSNDAYAFRAITVTANTGYNIAAFGRSAGTTAGANIGVQGDAYGGDQSAGVWGQAITAKNNAANIGVFARAINTGTGTRATALYATLGNLIAASAFERAAIIAENAATGAPLFIGRNNGTNVITFTATGGITASDTLSTPTLTLNGGVTIRSGSGSPEGAVTAVIGALYLRTNGSTGTTLYIKESGTGNTGWIAVALGGGGSPAWGSITSVPAAISALAAVTPAADKLPYFDSGSTAAVTDLSSFARTLLDDADASAARTTLGVVIGTNVQGYDSDLAAIAALTTTSYGRALLALADAAAGRTALGVVIGTDVQAYDSDLAAIAALSTTSFGRALLALADAAAGRTALGVTIGTDVQAYDSDLAAIAALATTSFGRSFLALADAAASRTYVGLGSVENTALSTWAGSTNLVTLGTIATGTWNGTTIAVANGGTGLTSMGTALQVLRVNAAGTALEYATVSGGGGSPGGSTGQLQYNNAGAFAGAANWIVDGTTGALTHTRTSLGTTTESAVELVNSTAASSGNQQVSPALIWTAQGWKTASGGASQTVQFRMHVLPVQGTTNPAATWLLEAQVNGGGYDRVLQVNSAGQIWGANNTASGPNIGMSSTSYIIQQFGTNQMFGVGNNVANMTTNVILGWTASTTVATAVTMLRSPAAATLMQGGADAASPVSQYFAAQNATGTNSSGAHRYIDGSQSTGLGAGGDIVLRSSPPGSSGSGQNALTPNLTLKGDAAKSVQAHGPVTFPSYAVSALPAAASYPYARVFVTDATAPAFGSTVAGGGSAKTPVWSDGTNWIVG